MRAFLHLPPENVTPDQNLDHTMKEENFSVGNFETSG